jgi:hypothetical protein
LPAIVARKPKRPSLPASRFVTIGRNAPLDEVGWRIHTPDFISEKANYFSPEGLTAISENQPSGKSPVRHRDE